MRTFEVWGSVRGGCGHAHRTVVSAQACADRDGARIGRGQRHGSLTRAYSDRIVIVQNPGNGGRNLTQYEQDVLDRHNEAKGW